MMRFGEMKICRFALLSFSFLAGCVAPHGRETFVPEREFPFEIGEPVYLLQPADLALRDAMSVWMPRQPPPSASAPIVALRAIGPKDTTPPVILEKSRVALSRIADELPPQLPKRAIFLISSGGMVVEVALTRARDKLNERIFAARLRALKFQPATYSGKSVAVICEVDLATGVIGSHK